MSKPVFEIEITTAEEKKACIKAVFDTGSFYSIIRKDKLPDGNFIRFLVPKTFGTASEKGTLEVIGSTYLKIKFNDKIIDVWTLISPQLKADMLIGSRTMHEWDITIANCNGNTEIKFGHDLSEPALCTVE